MTDHLRPTTLDEYIGQTKMKDRLRVMVAAAVARRRPVPHLLLAGPAGTGKTALATLIATMTGDDLHKLTLPVDARELERLVRYETGIFFLDEVHEANRVMQAHLKVLLEFGYLPTASGEVIPNGFFTVIGATTNTEFIPDSLYDRFVVPPFEPYSIDDMVGIVRSMAAKAEVVLDDDTVVALAHATNGSPRYALRLVEAAQRLADALFGISPAADEVLAHAGFDPDGLTEPHLLYLEALVELGGAIGLVTLSRHLRLHKTVCMDLERLLIRHHLIDYSGQGRRLTQAGRRRAVAHREEAA